MNKPSTFHTAPQLAVNATRRTLLGMSLLSALAVGGCATASGPTFSRVEAPQPDKAQLYLYRKSAMYAAGGKYKVIAVATSQPLGELFNASYLVLPLEVGPHVIGVEESVLISPKTFEIQAEAGKNYFVEYDSSKGWLLGWGILSGCEVKTEEQALADLKDLRRAN